MGKAIRTKDGKFAGSVGDGKTRVPTSGRPGASREAARGDEPTGSGVQDAYAAFQARQDADAMTAALEEAARIGQVMQGRGSDARDHAEGQMAAASNFGHLVSGRMEEREFREIAGHALRNPQSVFAGAYRERLAKLVGATPASDGELVDAAIAESARLGRVAYPFGGGPRVGEAAKAGGRIAALANYGLLVTGDSSPGEFTEIGEDVFARQNADFGAGYRDGLRDVIR